MEDETVSNFLEDIQNTVGADNVLMRTVIKIKWDYTDILLCYPKIQFSSFTKEGEYFALVATVYWDIWAFTYWLLSN